MDLHSRTALVTGAGSGIGRASAIRQAEAGATVGVLGHTPSELDKTAELIKAAGGKATPLNADVASLILFLASDLSRHITGTPVYIDGGQGLLQ